MARMNGMLCSPATAFVNQTDQTLPGVMHMPARRAVDMRSAHYYAVFMFTLFSVYQAFLLEVVYYQASVVLWLKVDGV